MKIRIILVLILIFILGYKSEQKKEYFPKLSTINEEVGVKFFINKVNSVQKDSTKVTLETLKKGSKKVIVDGKFYYKKNRGDYEIETRIEGKDSIHIYYDVVKQKDYDIKTKKLVSINLSEQ